MPRTRPSVARDAKVDEIVAAARDRLLAGGYAALSVAELARELGLAQNAIYWYFPTKDHLFVAGVERVLHEVLSRKPKKGDALSRVLWFAERLNEFQHLRVTMRDRAGASEVVASFENEVVQLFRFLLTGALQSEVDSERLDDTADAIMALCEGVLLRDVGKARRARMIRFGFERLVEQEPKS